VAILEDLSALLEGVAQAETIAAKMLAVVSQSYLLADHECLVTSSIEIRGFGVQPLSIEDVLQQSDIAMYQVKAKRGNTTRLFAPELQSSIDAHAVLEDWRILSTSFD
jgi:predicted signal transduction protein with EAL and GGDEF domain